MKKIQIRVRANASVNKVGGTTGEPPRLLVYVQAPAVDGKANAAVIKLLAKHFEVKVRNIEITSGETSRDKTIEIN